MTEKQKRFCLEYIKSGNATAAAKAAGYSSCTAYSIGAENLKKPEIQNYINEHFEHTETKGVAAAQEVLKFFSDVMRDKDAPLTNRIKAAENLAKRLGVDKPDGEADDERVSEILVTYEDASAETDEE